MMTHKTQIQSKNIPASFQLLISDLVEQAKPGWECRCLCKSSPQEGGEGGEGGDNVPMRELTQS